MWSSRPSTTGRRRCRPHDPADPRGDRVRRAPDDRRHLDGRAWRGTSPRAGRAALAAGCDVVLHCNGDLAEMEAVAAASGRMTEAARLRAERALRLRRAPSRLTSPPPRPNLRPCWTGGRMNDPDNVVSVEARLEAEALIVDVDGFEGPLDLLLTLSRTQKVDLRKISVPEARRAVSALHRDGARPADRARRRLPRHGGLARVPEVAAAPAARSGGRGAFGRGSGRASGVPARTAAGDARGGGAAHGARPEGAGLLRARGIPEGVERVGRCASPRRFSTSCRPMRGSGRATTSAPS
jgi:hypothetical protein